MENTKLSIVLKKSEQILANHPEQHRQNYKC